MTNIELPKDAEGRDIPLDTKVLYDNDNTELTVRSFDFKSDGYNKGWTVFCALGPNFMAQPYGSQELHLHRPDSWEKLLEDLETCDICEYFGYSKRASKDDYGCNNCKVYKISGNRLDDSDCFKKMIIDLASRIRKLMGECE